MKKSITLSVPSKDIEEDVSKESDWKNIIFLPFRPIWEKLVIFSVLINSLLSIFDAVFCSETLTWIFVTYYICEIIFFIDTVLLLMHRKFKKLRKKRVHKKTDSKFLTFDILSLIPVNQIQPFLSLSVWHYEEKTSKDYLKLKCLIRLYRIIKYFDKKLAEAESNEVLVLSVSHVFRLILISHISGAIIYLLRSVEGSWTRNLSQYRIDQQSPYSWVTLCYTLMASLFIHNWHGTIKPETNLEKLIFMLIMLIGYTFHIMLFLGYLTSNFKKIYYDFFEYETRVLKIVQMLEDWGVEDDLKKRTSDYYSVFWQKRMGIKNMPELFEILPASLRKEVTVDLFWDALKHSHFFANTDMSFKRSISLVMKNRFLLPGEFLFRIGEPKGTMVYLTSGVLQILSDEDDNSPILSFSHGTLLGESACLLAAKSISNVRSSTYCEIQTLALKDLHRILVNYPAVAKNVKQQLFHRLEKAKRQYQTKFSKVFLEKESIRTDMVEDPPIKKLKRYWKIIYDKDKKQKKGKDSSIIKFHGAEIIVENFDLLVLSRDAELKESVCLSDKCPYVMHPDSSFRIFCEFLVFTAVIIQSLVLPQAAFFQRKLSPGESSLCFLMDAIYFLDIYLQFATAVKVGNTLITDFRQIVLMRLKQMSFLVDLLSSFPVDYLIMLGPTGRHVAVVWKLMRLLKIYKIYFLLEFLQRKMILDMIAVKILKYVLLYIFSTYWLACLLYGLSCVEEPCHENSWLKYTYTMFGLPIATTWRKFWSSLYLTITLLLNYGENSYDGFIIVDIILLHAIAFFGHLIYSYGFAELTAMLVLKNQAIKFSNRHLKALKKEATQYNVTATVRANALNFLHLQKYESIGESDLFKNIPFELKNEIMRHRIINNLRKVPLFTDSSDELLRYICSHSKLKLIPQDSTILSFENKSDTLYVITKGYCRMYSSLPGDLERKSSSVLKSGDMFPFLESFHDAFSFLRVEALTAVEIILLPTRIILNAFQTDERDNGCFKSALAYHKQVYGSILFRKGARLPMLTPVEKSKRRGPMFEFSVYDVDYVKFSEDAFREPFKKLGGWSFIRFFLIRKTINPNGKFYICWEICRCFIALTQMIILIIYPNILVVHVEDRQQLVRLSTILSGICLLDLYIRFHCQYYNKKGILVKHPLKTAQYYVARSFVIDCIGIMPIQSIGVHYLLGKDLELWLYIFLCFSTRYLQLYRLYHGMTYLAKRYDGVIRNMVDHTKFVIFVLVSMGCLAAVFQLLTCDIKSNTFVCTNWLMGELERTSIRGINNHLLYSYYKMSNYFTLGTSGNPSYSSNMLVAVLIIIPLYIYRWSILSRIVSKGIGGNIELTTYRNRLKNYLYFLKGAKVDNETIYAIVHHYEYTWKKSRGINMYRIMKYFHPHLEQELTYSQYSNCLERAYLFRGEHENLFKAISPLLHREYYIKDSKIIQCNDVQNKIFFVQEGSIKITIANTTLATLLNGGMFGCLSKAGVTRQTLTAIAVVHSTVLTIDSKIFHNVIVSFPKVQDRIKKVNLLHSEYLQESTGGLSTVKSVNSLYDRHEEFFDMILIRHDYGWYPKFEYIMDVHVNPLTALSVLGVAFINTEKHARFDWIYFYYIILILDAIHLIEILVKFHVTYEDPISGKIVKDPYLIRKRFLRSTFWCHFFTVIPIDQFVNSYVVSNFIIKLCTLNRAVRFIFLVLYYNQSEAKIAMKKHLKWTYMVYKNLFYIQILVCFWMSICTNSRCSYNDSTSKSEGSIRIAKNVIDSIIIGYLHVINIYTTCGLRSILPNTPVQLIITIIISLITVALTAALCNGFLNLIMVERHNFSLYKQKLNRFWVYLKALELSPFLCKKVRNYCLVLWEWQRGCWLPILIQEAPNFLKQNLLHALYGKHLSTHILFAKTHVDFLRQLVGHLERTVFLPGYSVVEKGDLDCSMYFINKGEIDEIDFSGKTERTIRTLTGGMSFGEAQGLLCSSHAFSYRANTSADILILNKNRWKYLLNWFPASKEEIIERALEYGFFSKEEAVRL